MKNSSFVEGGSGNGPPLSDEEAMELTKERKLAARVRRSASQEETAFRQANRADVFSARNDAFSGDPTDSFSGKSRKFQQKAVRRGYAKTLRAELEDMEVSANPDESVFEAGSDRLGRTARKFRKQGSFHTGGQPIADAAGWPSRRKNLLTRRFQRTGDAGVEGIRGTIDKSVLSGEESDAVSSKAIRGGYGAARLSAEGARKTIHAFGEKVRSAKDAHFLIDKGREAGRHFSAERMEASGNAAVIRPKTSAFYGVRDAQSAEAVRQKSQKAFQKRVIQRNYQYAKGEKVYIPFISRIRAKARAKSGEAAAVTGKTVARKIAEFFETHPMVLIFLILSGILATIIGAAISGGTMLMTHGIAPSTLATTYTAEDADIKGADSDYSALEAELSGQVADLETAYPGYASYELTAGQIGHDPYKLAALLTVMHEDYKREDVQESLRRIFETQYNLSMSDEAGSVERKTVRVGQSLGNVVTSGYCSCSICCGQWAGGPTASGVMPTTNHTIAVDAYDPIVPMGTKIVMNGIEYTVEDTGAFARFGVAFDVYYDDHSVAQQHGHQTWEAFISDANGAQEVEVMVSSGHQEFSATLKNNGLDYVAEKLLTADEKERYDLLVELKGNKPELFANDIYANGTIPFDYSIPGEALSDQKFANMMAEAQKYLGYPYVWGGSTPSSSFDCSGFVCWVINNSGNGWSVGRTTADGLCNMLAKVAPEEAKPGDIIFFQGTYDTVGASHVGIYLGDNMMIHCGNPIQYARTDTAYWQQHFYCFGRLPS